MLTVIYLWEEKCETRNGYPREISEVLPGDAIENEMNRRTGDALRAALSFRVESPCTCGHSDTPVLSGKRKQCPAICNHF